MPTLDSGEQPAPADVPSLRIRPGRVYTGDALARRQEWGREWGANAKQAAENTKKERT